MKRFLPLVSFLGLALLLALLLLNKGTASDANAQAALPMPTIHVTSLDGKIKWNEKTLRGKVTLINVYASWCTPCADEMPELAALKKQFPALQMEGIAWNDAPETLKAWLKKHGNPFDRLWFDTNGEATILLGIRGIPESLIVDSKGMIRYRLKGPLNQALREGEIGGLIAALMEEAHAK